jgi:hypothetical protein
MTSFSLILSYNIIKSKQRVMTPITNTNRKQKVHFQNEINLAVSSISLY